MYRCICLSSSVSAISASMLFFVTDLLSFSCAAADDFSTFASTSTSTSICRCCCCCDCDCDCDCWSFVDKDMKEGYRGARRGPCIEDSIVLCVYVVSIRQIEDDPTDDDKQDGELRFVVIERDDRPTVDGTDDNRTTDVQ